MEVVKWYLKMEMSMKEGSKEELFREKGKWSIELGIFIKEYGIVELDMDKVLRSMLEVSKFILESGSIIRGKVLVS